jgi:hypothetical protein
MRGGTTDKSTSSRRDTAATFIALQTDHGDALGAWLQGLVCEVAAPMSAAMLTADPDGPMPSAAHGPMPVPKFEDFAATQIQAAYRGHSVRIQLQVQAQAAAHIQGKWRQSRQSSARAVRVLVNPSQASGLSPWPLHDLHAHRADGFTPIRACTRS